MGKSLAKWEGEKNEDNISYSYLLFFSSEKQAVTYIL